MSGHAVTAERARQQLVMPCCMTCLPTLCITSRSSWKGCWCQQVPRGVQVCACVCGVADLLKQSVKRGEFAGGAVVLQHAAQHHDAGLGDVAAHQLVHHILAEHQAMHYPAVARSAYISHPLHLMQPSCPSLRGCPHHRKTKKTWSHTQAVHSSV